MGLVDFAFFRHVLSIVPWRGWPPRQPIVCGGFNPGGTPCHSSNSPGWQSSSRQSASRVEEWRNRGLCSSKNGEVRDGDADAVGQIGQGEPAIEQEMVKLDSDCHDASNRQGLLFIQTGTSPEDFGDYQDDQAVDDRKTLSSEHRARAISPMMTAHPIRRIRVVLAGTNGWPSRRVRNTARSSPITHRARASMAMTMARFAARNAPL